LSRELGHLRQLLLLLDLLEQLLLLNLLEQLLLLDSLERLLLHQLRRHKPLRHAWTETTAAAVTALSASDVRRKTAGEDGAERGEKKKCLPTPRHESSSSKMGVQW
jgi:hypothetical protein